MTFFPEKPILRDMKTKNKVKKPTLKEIVQFCIHLQNDCDLNANASATLFIKDHNLEKLHQKLTGNPDLAYMERT